MKTTKTRKPRKPGPGLYLGDNGRCLCRAHLGVTAATTGHDLSGQPLLRLTVALIEAEGVDPRIYVCEQCGVGIEEAARA